MPFSQLWTARELATYLCYKESTVARMASQCPHKLPPRVAGLGNPRLDPEIVESWVRDQSLPEINRRRGRPRNTI